MRKLFGLILGLVLFAAVPVDAEVFGVTLGAQEAADAAAALGAWNYHQSEDPMTGKTYYTANVVSSNVVRFGWPYGEQRGYLTIRTHPRWGKDVLSFLNNGHFPCSSWDGCSILVRFDDRPPQRFRALPPEDGDSNTLFFAKGEYSRFVGEIMKAKTVRISALFYQEGNPVFTFDVSGFNAKRYLGKREDFSGVKAGASSTAPAAQ